MGIFDSIGLDEATISEAEGLLQAGMAWAESAQAVAGDITSAIDEGTATLQDLGLLPTPPGAPEGGRWAVTAAGEAVYLPPDYEIASAWLPSTYVRLLPLWIPVGNSPGEDFARHLLQVWYQLGAQESDVISIGQASPMAGIAPEGTSFEQLTPEDQRKYLANSYAIAAAKNRYTPSVMLGSWQILDQQQKNLGWVPAPSGARGLVDRPTTPGAVCEGAAVGPDGLPYRLIHCDRDEAARRLYAVAKGLVGAPGAPVMAQFGIEAGTEAWRECTVPGISQSDLVACVERYRGSPGMAEELERLFGPWRPFALPGKFLQLVEGLDGSKYVVSEIGGKQRGAKLWIVASVGTGTLLVGSLTAVGLGWLLFTRKGKQKLRKWFK